MPAAADARRFACIASRRIVQIGIAVPFLVISGVMIDRVRTADFGFPTDGLAGARLPVPDGPEQEAGFAIRRVRDNLQQASGVRSVALAEGMPIDFDYREFRVADERREVRHRARDARRRKLSRDRRRDAAARSNDHRRRPHHGGAGRGDFRTARRATVSGKEAIGERVTVTLEESREQEFTIVGVSADFATSQLTTMRLQILLPLPEALPRTVHSLIARGAPGDEPKLKAGPRDGAPRVGCRAAARCGVPRHRHRTRPRRQEPGRPGVGVHRRRRRRRPGADSRRARHRRRRRASWWPRAHANWRVRMALGATRLARVPHDAVGRGEAGDPRRRRRPRCLRRC